MGEFERAAFRYLTLGGMGCAGVVFITLFFIPAPYGRYTRTGWGPRINSSLAWVVMESFAVGVLPACFFLSAGMKTGTASLFVILWEIHYVHRTCIFPLRRHKPGRTMPIVIVGSAVAFNVFNGYLNGRYLGVYADLYTGAWLLDPRFLAGTGLFLTGLVVNIHSDEILLRLRRSGETGYKIPYGGLYRWISCPNYLGELLEWTGWAVATWSLPGLVFALWTAANLVPRAYAHHRWYHAYFSSYPPDRKALFPYVF